MLENAHERIAGFLCNNHPDVVPAILDYMGVSASNDCFDDLIQLLRSIHEDRDLPRLTEFFLGFDDVTFVYNMLYEVFDGNVFDEIFGTSTYYPVLQQALFHCAPRTGIQNFFLAWAPSNMGVLRTVVGDAYLMYLVYNAYPSFFTTQVMDNIGVEEFYRAFERMANFNISDLMALLQNSMEPGKYDDFAASVPSFLSYEEKISLTEHYIYGSQRLGAKKATKQLQSHTLQYESGNWLPQEVNYMAEPVPAYVAKAAGLVDVGYALGTWLTNGKLKYPQEATYTRKLGYKEYELTNHLGNVQATILDRRLGIKANPSDTIFSYVEADVKTAQDYYPFGMMMPGRHYTSGSSSIAYRYGFNGMEKDNEVFGKGNSLDFGERIYDSRLGRFLSIDFLTDQYPWYSPYQFAGNTPIQAIDIDGLEPLSMVQANGKLTAPMVGLLNTAFAFSKTSLQSTTWVPYTKDISTKAWASMVSIPGKTAASVMGKRVVHDNNQNRSNTGWFGLIAHEQSHQADIANQGTSSFYTIYIVEGVHKGYKGITTEQYAYQIGSASGKGYAGQLFGYQNGAVMQILNNSKLTEDQKTAALESIGSKFRRDVILENRINLNTAIILSTQNLLQNSAGLSNDEIDS